MEESIRRNEREEGMRCGCGEVVWGGREAGKGRGEKVKMEGRCRVIKVGGMERNIRRDEIKR